MLCARSDPKFLDAGLLRRLQAQQRQDSTDTKTRSHAGGLRILLRSRLFRRLTVCLMVSGIVTDGLSDLLIQYFKLLFNFTVRDVVRFQHLFFRNIGPPHSVLLAALRLHRTRCGECEESARTHHLESV